MLRSIRTQEKRRECATVDESSAVVAYGGDVSQRPSVIVPLIAAVLLLLLVLWALGVI